MEPLDPELVRCLALSGAYPDDPDASSGVEWVQTHISHVFMTASLVYKLRKAVVLPFLSFAPLMTCTLIKATANPNPAVRNTLM